MTDDEMTSARDQDLAAILAPLENNKVVVAGPGTGKTHTFKELADRTKGPVLALTFLNKLAAELSLELGERATTRTLHRYSHRLLRVNNVSGITPEVDYYPPFMMIIREDAALADLPTGDFDKAFMKLNDSHKLISTGLKVGDYYNAVGHTDSVYRVYRLFESSPSAIPKYSQVLVDEYQDFSLLETKIIAALSEGSPTLVVGDDDQALYGFRHADADYLRDLIDQPGWTKLDLRFCTRCTKVMVAAVKCIVENAQANGRLVGRVPKEYICYLPKKRADSGEYPKIMHVSCSTETPTCPYTGRYIAKRLAAIPKSDIVRSLSERRPTVLIMGENPLLGLVHKYLLAQSIPNVQLRKSSKLSIEAIHGYRRIMMNPRSKLGWRIILGLRQPVGWQSVIKQCLLGDKEIVDELNDAFKKEHLEVARLLKVFTEGEPLTSEEVSLLRDETGLDEGELRLEFGIALDEDVEEETELAIEDSDAPTILLTSFQGAKGLQAEHVFILGMNEGCLPKSNSSITDEDVCKLLVALTRGTKSCTIISSIFLINKVMKQSAFVAWLNPTLQPLRVDKNYWSGANESTGTTSPDTASA